MGYPCILSAVYCMELQHANDAIKQAKWTRQAIIWSVCCFELCSVVIKHWIFFITANPIRRCNVNKLLLQQIPLRMKNQLCSILQFLATLYYFGVPHFEWFSPAHHIKTWATCPTTYIVQYLTSIKWQSQSKLS